MSTTATATVAAALAGALLAGRWTERAMCDRITRALGTPGRRLAWVRPLVRRVLVSYPRPPLDAPRGLAEFLRDDEALHEAVSAHLAAAGGSAPMVRRRSLIPVRMQQPGTAGTPTWAVPPLDTVADLARLLRISVDEIDWFAGLTHPARSRAASGTSVHYRYRWLAKPSGGHRLLEIPLPRLAALQRHVLRAILEPIPPHDAAHGFRRGRSALTHAAVHTGRATVLRLDLESFFATVTAGRVYGVFRTAGYAEPVAHALTGLLTTITPRPVRAAAPAAPTWAVAGSAARLDAALRTPHLAQGAPSSPALASLCLHRLDRRLAGLAASLPGDVRYSRYADDLVLSGDSSLSGTGLTGAVAALVTGIVTDCGLRVAAAKTRRLPQSSRQLVTGLVVNEHVAVRRPEVDRVRALVHDARVHGPAAANRTDHPDFRDHLLGLVSWVAATGTPRARRIADEARLISW